MRINDLVFLILNYNSYDLTIQAVDNVLSLDLSVQILIVDNCSTNNSVSELKYRFDGNDNVQIIVNDKNSGYASGNNYGLRYIDEKLNGIKYVIIMNPDIIIPTRETVIDMYTTMNNRQQYGMLTTRVVLNGIESKPNTCAWKFLSKPQLLFDGTIFKNLVKMNIYYENFSESEEVIDVDIVQGCFFIIDFNMFKQVGFFDERTFLYGEEAILGKKVKGINRKAGVLHKHYIHHNHKEKDKFLKDYKRKCFDSECYHKSRLIYINNYMGNTFLFKMIANIYLRLDLRIKKILYRLIKI